MSEKAHRTYKTKASSSYDFLAKIVTLGDTTIGKSSLILKFTEGSFTYSQLPTIGVDYKLKTVAVEGKKLKLEIWDTAGQERFRSIATDNLKKAHGIILCYAVNNRESFMNIEYWMEQINNSASRNSPIILVATKKDVDACQNDFLPPRSVDEAEGRALAAKYGIAFLETSSVDGTNIKEVFETIGKLVLQKHDPVPEPQPIEPIEENCFFAFLKLFKKEKKEVKKPNKALKNSIIIASEQKGLYQRVQR